MARNSDNNKFRGIKQACDNFLKELKKTILYYIDYNDDRRRPIIAQWYYRITHLFDKPTYFLGYPRNFDELSENERKKIREEVEEKDKKYFEDSDEVKIDRSIKRNKPTIKENPLDAKEEEELKSREQSRDFSISN